MSKLGELKEILKKLIAIPSVTGNEHDIAIYIADYLRQCGVDSVELQPVEGNRLNVVAHLKGESAVYVFEKERAENAAGTPVNEYASMEEALPEAGASAFAFAEDFISAYDAKLCFAEEIGGTLSFYCYSPRLKGGVILNGRKINLHIAVRAESVAVGTPIIFGGY